LENLIEKAQDVEWNLGRRKEYYTMLLKSDLTDSCLEKAKKNTLLFNLENKERKTDGKE